jgi:beta-ketodecanoyl-[acyl-carrier-protein] synthase
VAAVSTTGIALTGVGVHAPPSEVSNEALCDAYNAWVRAERPDLQESHPAFIEKASGIRFRHFVDAEGILDPTRLCPRIPDRPDDVLSVQAELALAAASPALAEAGRAGSEVDLVIVAASALQRPYPALAIEVQAALGAAGHGFDVGVGCSSATFAIALAVDALRAGRARCVLVCVPEVPSAYANFRDRDSHFILGDAAAAVVVERVEDAADGGWEILASVSHSRFSSAVRNNGGFLNRGDASRRDLPDKLFYQQGRRVFRDIVGLVPEVMQGGLDAAGLAIPDIDRFWLHQANGRMNAAILKRLLGREGTTAEAPSTLERFGNTAAAGVLQSFAAPQPSAVPGDIGLLCAFGAGYTVGLQVLRRLG